MLEGRGSVRWLVLVLASLLSLGSYYCYDNPSALHDQLKQKFKGTAYEPHFEVYFNLLYTVYSIPNCFLPLVGGILAVRSPHPWIGCVKLHALRRPDPSAALF